MKHLLLIPVIGIGGIVVGMALAIIAGTICDVMFDVKDAILWMPKLLFKPFTWTGLFLGLVIGGYMWRRRTIW